MAPTTKVRGVRCLHCQDEIWSRHRHDFRYCKCRKTFVDGGRDYLRYGCDDLSKVEPIDIEVSE